MEKEFDVRTYIRELRVSAFISRLILTRTQLFFINKMPKYSLALTDQKPESEVIKEKEKEQQVQPGYASEKTYAGLEDHIRKLSTTDAKDRRIMRTFMGKKIFEGEEIEDR